MSDHDNRGQARLAQFYTVRLAPAKEGLACLQRGDNVRLAWTVPFFQGNFFESIGWIIEGVFCGYFPRGDADLVWTRTRDLLNKHVSRHRTMNPSASVGALVDQLRGTLAKREAFSVADQMPPGKERDLEQSLFGHAVLLSNRFTRDRLARRCVCSLNFLDDERWSFLINDIPVADEVAASFLSLEPSSKLSTSLVLAGFVRVLEHMAASKEFFGYAKHRYSALSGDFTALQARLGTLQAWMLNFEEPRLEARFEQLLQLFDLVLQQEVSSKVPWIGFSKMSDRFQSYANSLRQTWGVDHPFHAYAFFGE